MLDLLNKKKQLSDIPTITQQGLTSRKLTSMYFVLLGHTIHLRSYFLSI